jgi:uncharacterized protein (TIGR02246 family)
MRSPVSPYPSRARTRWPVLAIVAILILAPCAGAAEKSDSGADKKSPEAAIRAAADAFVQAFNRGDAKAVAAHWTANGSLTDEQGQTFKGRKVIEEQYAALFKQRPGARIEISVKSVEILSETTAVEDGIAQLIAKQAGPAMAGRYTAVHVRDGGQWLMASVRESSIPIASGFGRLEDLAWLIGSWKTKGDGAAVHTSFRWIANKSFIQRDHEVRHDGVVTDSGTQIIGFDPQAGQIRSWSFDSSGGHGTSLWSPSPEGWLIESMGTLTDGTPTSSRELLIRVAGENHVFGWRSFDRRAGQTPLADLREVVLDRVPEKR